MSEAVQTSGMKERQVRIYSNNLKDLYCETCMFLNLTEEEQNRPENKKFNRQHYCNNHEKKLVHMGYGMNHHPHILRCEECLSSHMKEIISVETNVIIKEDTQENSDKPIVELVLTIREELSKFQVERKMNNGIRKDQTST